MPVAAAEVEQPAKGEASAPRGCTGRCPSARARWPGLRDPSVSPAAWTWSPGKGPDQVPSGTPRAIALPHTDLAPRGTLARSLARRGRVPGRRAPIPARRPDWGGTSTGAISGRGWGNLRSSYRTWRRRRPVLGLFSSFVTWFPPGRLPRFGVFFSFFTFTGGRVCKSAEMKQSIGIERDRERSLLLPRPARSLGEPGGALGSLGEPWGRGLLRSGVGAGVSGPRAWSRWPPHPGGAGCKLPPRERERGAGVWGVLASGPRAKVAGWGL